MATAVLRLGVGSDAWNLKVDSTVEAASSTLVSASRLSTTISVGLARMRLAWSLNQFANKLSSMVDGVYQAAEKAEKKPVSSSPSTPEQIESALRSLEYIHDAAKRLYVTGKTMGLTNSSLTAGPLRIVQRRAEELTDIEDWLRAALAYSPAELDEIYSKARKDLEHGEVCDLSQVR